MAGRVRTLADAVNDLTIEIRQARAAAAAITAGKFDDSARRTAERLAVAIEALSEDLGRTNQHLSDLARRPIVGFLGGGAEAELQRLVSKVDGLRKALGGWRELVPQ